MIPAAEHGRVGERYLISEKTITNAEVVRIAAEAAGVPAPTKTLPLPVAYALAALGTAKARLRGSDERLTLNALRLMRAEAPVDCAKARRELGWQPRPVEESIREAALWWFASGRRSVQLEFAQQTPLTPDRTPEACLGGASRHRMSGGREGKRHGSQRRSSNSRGVGGNRRGHQRSHCREQPGCRGGFDDGHAHGSRPWIRRLLRPR